MLISEHAGKQEPGIINDNTLAGVATSTMLGTVGGIGTGFGLKSAGMTALASSGYGVLAGGLIFAGGTCLTLFCVPKPRAESIVVTPNLQDQSSDEEIPLIETTPYKSPG